MQERIKPQIEPECFCLMCGIALLPHEVAGEFRAEYADYVKHRIGKIDSVFCYECWSRMVTNSESGLEVAKKRREKLFRDKK